MEIVHPCHTGYCLYKCKTLREIQNERHSFETVLCLEYEDNLMIYADDHVENIPNSNFCKSTLSAIYVKSSLYDKTLLAVYGSNIK